MKTFSPSSKSVFVWSLRVIPVVMLGWYLFCLTPVGNGALVQDVSFPAGSGIKKLASNLKQAGVIRSTWHFVLLSRLRGQAHRLKAGEYRFNDGMSSSQILQKLVNGDVDYRRFALPEGYSIYQAAELLDQKGYFDKTTFLAACRDKRLLQRFNITAESVEGYLFPATYNLTKNETAESLITQMVEQFVRTARGIATTAGRAGLGEHELVTLASLIEKEAVAAAEKPLISSVFHNRLRIAMPLQSDPTAVYGIRAFSGKVTKADIERISPYNTYRISGLPPGPIGNPGLDAIRAAANPATSRYLYFVARQDGTHQFSATLDEHNRAVNRYLK